MLEKLFRSRAGVAILSVALFGDSLHLREIARRAGVSPFEAKRELDILEQLGALRKEKKANLSLYSPNEGCAFIGELKSLYIKMEGAKKAAGAVAGQNKPRKAGRK